MRVGEDVICLKSALSSHAYGNGSISSMLGILSMAVGDERRSRSKDVDKSHGPGRRCHWSGRIILSSQFYGDLAAKSGYSLIGRKRAGKATRLAEDPERVASRVGSCVQPPRLVV